MSNYQGNFRYKTPSEGEYNLIANFIALGNFFVYFDGQEIDGDSILGMSQEGSLFEESFKLGSSVCRTVSLKVLKNAVEQHPSKVVIKDINNVVRFTLYVDSVNEENINFYSYKLCDSMVKLNAVYDFSEMTNPTVQGVLNGICADILNCPTVTLPWGGSIPINYDNSVTARNIVEYAAEISGGFARIDENGNLQIIRFQNNSPFETSVEMCEDFTLGEHHTIGRVFLELGVASYEYPINYQGDGDTVYLNPSNVLFTDSGSYTIQTTLQHVYDMINGYEFYSAQSNRCYINQTALPGDPLVFTLNGESYPTITQIDWEFNIEWKGGYSCLLETAIQEETSIIPDRDKVRRIKITVDRALNEITQQILAMDSTVKVVAADFVQRVDLEYGQSTSSSVEPASWSTTAPAWNDNLVMWQRARTYYLSGQQTVTGGEIVTKEDGKTVSLLHELYFCSQYTEMPALPTARVTADTDVYEQWTLKCPVNNPPCSVYYICTQLVYSDGTCSWEQEGYIAGSPSNSRLSQEVVTLTTSMSEINQRATGIELNVQQIEEVTIADLETRTQTLETCVNIQPDGVRISQGSLGAYTLLTDEGMEIYAEGNKVAYALKDGFYAMDYIMNGWHMTTTNGNNSFNFVRKEYN